MRRTNDRAHRSGRTRAISLTALLALIIGGAIGGVLSGAGAGAASRSADSSTHRELLALVAVPTKQAFIDNADDRSRGTGNNPFGNYRGSHVSSKDELTSGPFAGDEGIFEYALSAAGSPHAKAGSAMLVCQYGFDRSSFCEASYRLANGSLTGAGSFDARADSFGLSITGGTGSYRGVSGDVDVTVSPGAKRSPLLVLRSQRLAFALDRPTSAGSKHLTSYSVTKKEQFIHNGDDEARGIVSSPFRLHDAAAVQATKGGALGPFPGDEALFSFAVYTAPSLATKVGSATFTCLYAFDNNALCDASYTFAGGTLTGAGAVDFEARNMALVVTGGTGKYSGLTGDLGASPSANHVQRLAFALGAG